MFVISQTNSYIWPVQVEFPIDGGKTDKQTFDGEFKRLSQTRIEEIRKSLDEGTITDRSLAAEVLVGWKGVVDDKGEDVPFSEGARDTLLNVQKVASAVVLAFITSLTGAKRKN